MRFPFALFAGCFALVGTVESKILDNTFIIKLSPDASLPAFDLRLLKHHDLFHRRAAESSLDYTVRHTYNAPDTYVGLSIEVHGSDNSDNVRNQLLAISGVEAVAPVFKIVLPDPNLSNSALMTNPALSYDELSKIEAVPTPKSDGNLGSALQMAGVDKLHELGIRGKGIKIGIIDTGVDYRNPALGGGFGSGFKIAGGYAFLDDNGNHVNSTDPLTTCISAGHGTHVAGIIGMDPLGVTEGYNITGVAPEAELYMYRVFDCEQSGGSDDTLAAMLKAQSDGVDLVSMSLNIGAELPDVVDPLAEVTARLHDAGIAVIVAAGNSGSAGKNAQELYSEGQPSELPGAIAVGAIANKDFPLVWTATDSAGSIIPYASLWPIEYLEGADLYMLDDGCVRSQWDDAVELLNSEGKLNSTIIGFMVTDACRPTEASICCSDSSSPVYMMGIYSDTSNPYYVDYDVPSTGYFDTAHFTAVSANDSVTLLADYQAAGGYGSYKLVFNDSSYSSPSQFVGGKVDYYSSFGPIWLNYTMKPQISAPGGHTLSTWPLGPLANYTILSGTSMATPYVSGCYALVKSQFPDLSVDEILTLLQSNSNPANWAWDETILSATAQQGAGLINAYDAIMSQTRVSPGQLLVTDNSRDVYGAVNITIENDATLSKTYTLSHEGAGYLDYQLEHFEVNQLPKYGSANFPTPTIELAAGASTNVAFTIAPPDDVEPDKLPVFGGFIKVSSGGEVLNVPYAGPPYSLFNTDYIHFDPSSPLPRVYFDFPNGTRVIDTDIVTVNSSINYKSSISRDQYTRSFRVDVLPANTSIQADKYGFDTTIEHDYVISTVAPRSSIFGYPSYGTLVNQTGLVSPASNIWPSGTGVSVTAADGATYSPGIGDYRWLVSVLRWGGDDDLLQDHDTWLGPIIRIVEGLV
ncbi:peptidase S8/S53 domain-containing protein [Xylariales sp. AK1849]|nr:peptidase S8/S53 domain-containing protein [Xylariales sp. AK1849]